ncbi:thrombospondin type 3 repeat-containing protein [Akkermansiaceae bacterium]|nr:thrombospondin type 3 repeat-containing protein [Akkermansiaceae bacterium]
MARQVGAQVSSVFNNSNGANENGIEVVSILLATEAGGSNITTTKSIANLNGYQIAGLDAVNNGQNLRDGFAYFRGVPITSWPVGDRRRVVVINGSANSSSHSQWEIIYNQQFPSYPGMVSAINSVEATPTGLDFATWQAGLPFPDGLSGPNDDPDGDGIGNLLEFAAGTDPLDSNSLSPGELIRSNGMTSFRYQLATDRTGITHRLQSGGLENFTDFISESPEIIPISDTVNQITIPLGPGSRGFVRQVVSLQP